jgi:hypothetical protein
MEYYDDQFFKDSYAVTIASEPEPEPERGKLVFLNNHQRDPFALPALLRTSATTLGKGCLGASYLTDLGSSSPVVVKRLKNVTATHQHFENHRSPNSRHTTTQKSRPTNCSLTTSPTTKSSGSSQITSPKETYPLSFTVHLESRPFLRSRFGRKHGCRLT